MSEHPYRGLPDRQFWKRDPGIEVPGMLDPVDKPEFTISTEDRIVTAGSCFAQHVARHLVGAGFRHHVVEQAHHVIHPQIALDHNYGMFAARYGNIYTARQLRQLLERAWGRFTPVASSWAHPDGFLVDPFRPRIQPGGFVDEEELTLERAQHLACVRKAFEEMDVFVFTLGLTETWADRRDGAVFPLAPGVYGGSYDEATAEFLNFDETETFDDLAWSLQFIRSINPGVRFILTVSPVPLNATYERRHVLVSTTISKARLRLAAERAVAAFDKCCYFPSYEIITSPHARGRYFAEDAREVLPAGVLHVMSLFSKHFLADERVSEAHPTAEQPAERPSGKIEQMLDVFCDEEILTNAGDPADQAGIKAQ